MAQSELFEQWKLSLSDAVASKHGLDQVNKQAVADQDIQVLEEEMQDVSVTAGQRMFTDVDMPQWWQTDSTAGYHKYTPPISVRRGDL